jgi:Xaa-Pro aminopeptidase
MIDTTARLISRLEATGIDSLLITHPPNIRYLTGYTGDNAYAVANGSGITLFVYKLNSELAEQTINSGIALSVVEDTLISHLSRLDGSFWGKTTGYEPESIVVATFRKIENALNGTVLKPASGIVEALRSVKSPEELDKIERAQKITDKVFGESIPYLSEGVTERDIAAEIEYRFRRSGADGPSFETIVAFGARASMPHSLPGHSALRHGDVVLIDMGTIVDGYASDMTRTVVFGQASDKLKEHYSLVLEAQLTGIGAVRCGASGIDIYRAARAIFERAGVADRFIHSLGHGVGIEVHELPALSPRSADTLAEGMVITIEPGLYFPDQYGIRIEDMAVVTRDGCRILTGSPKTLIQC